MEEDPRSRGDPAASSGIVAITIMDEREEKLNEARTVSQRAMTEVLSDLKNINKRLDKHSSNRQQVGRGGSSGFYKVPEDMRRRAGSKEAAGLLYDPKHVNFSKIRELFGKDDPDDDVQTLSQMRHYHYHLRSYANRMGNEEDIEGVMWDLCQDFEVTIGLPTVDMINGVSETSSREHLSGSPVIWANIFLSDLFHRSLQGELSATDDPECSLLWVSELWADLLLLENQIPLVEGILTTNIYQPVLSYFADFVPLNAKEVSEVVPRQSHKLIFFHHILHLIHDMLLPACRSKPRSHPLAWFWSPKEAAPSTMKPVPTATTLQHAGVKFKPVDEAGFVVEFKRGVLKLPRLHITKCTKKVFMNLIAWEICHHRATRYFINYAIFMDHLVNTSKDVEILIQSGVFEHSLATDEEVAALFNGLSQDLVYTKNALVENQRYDIFPKLTLDINNYCKSKRNVWWANLMQDYFKSPWSIISLIAALVLILLTLVQTFFSGYSYFRPPQ